MKLASNSSFISHYTPPNTLLTYLFKLTPASEAAKARCLCISGVVLTTNRPELWRSEFGSGIFSPHEIGAAIRLEGISPLWRDKSARLGKQICGTVTGIFNCLSLIFKCSIPQKNNIPAGFFQKIPFMRDNDFRAVQVIENINQP